MTEAELDILAAGGVVVTDRALPDELADRWLAHLQQLDRAGALTPAGLGRTGERAPELRSDRTAALSSDDPRWDELIEVVRALAAEIAAGLRLALPRASLQGAVYEPGARYDRHVDAIRGDPGRRITALWYVDRAWTAEDGGALRIGEQEIAPIGGRRVLFRADLVEHEVLPPRRPRYAVTAWLGTAGAIALDEPGLEGRARRR